MRDRPAPDPDVFLDYDPLPYELILRRAYAAQGWTLAGDALKEREDSLDARNAFFKLLNSRSGRKRSI